MKKISLLFITLMFFMLHTLYGVDDVFIPDSKLHLQKSYQVSKSNIYSTDMFPHIDKHFKVASLPADKFSLKLKSVDIKLIFMRYGYEIVSFESDVVEFVFVSDMRENKALDFIEKMYIKYYGENLKIENVLVRPLGNLPKDYEVIDFELSEVALKKPNGTLSLKYRTPSSAQIKKLTFLYRIEGTLQVLKSTQNIAADEVINAHNTRTEAITFARVGAEYINKDDLNKSSAKSFIRADIAITRDKIKPKIIVRKGDKIRVLGYENGISMEVVLEARQNGIYNEIINAKNPGSGKILRVRITDEGKGEIL